MSSWRGFLTARPVPAGRATRTAVVAAVVLALTATGATSVPPATVPSGARSADAGPSSRPQLDVEKTKLVASRSLKAAGAPRSAAAAMPSVHPDDASWPGAATLTLDGTKRSVKAGPVTLRRDGDEAASSDATVKVLDQDVAVDAGVDGMLLTLDAATAKDPTGLELSIDYSTFAGAYGADWASRLRVVRLPACVLETPEKPECQVQTPVESSNDLASSTVVADLGDSATAPEPTVPAPTPTATPEERATAVPTSSPMPSASATPTTSPTPPTSPAPTPSATPEPTTTIAPSLSGDTTARGAGPSVRSVASMSRYGTATPDAVIRSVSAKSSVRAASAGTVGVLALTAGTSGPSGNFGASPLSPSSTWNVSPQTGDFTWSYPIKTPPAAAGPEPELALGYSSGSLDGRVAGQNTQTSWIGDGWDLSTGFIERKYVPCAQDRTGANNASGTVTGDLCWSSYNATMAFGGRGGELVKDATSGAWKLKDDDGTRIELLTGAGNSDNNGEYWKVTTPDGTQYFFGRGKRSTSDTTPLNSTWLVPVYGNHPGEPCYAATFAASICLQAWRWNLEYVVDVHGNSMTYVYTKEENKYTRNNGSGVNTYTRGGYLDHIEYGQRAGSESAARAPQRVDFTVAERCIPSGAITCDPAQLTAANAASWPDVPFDLICDGTTCPTSPSFFTRKRLTSITTKVWTGEAYQDVDSFTLEHTYPDPGDTTSPSLWLASIQQKGLVGTAITVPKIQFTGTQMANRVDTLGDQAPPMNRYRITAIDTDTGGKLSVNYTPKDCAAGNLPASPDTNTRRCFPAMWTPPDNSAGQARLEYFHKYLVESVVSNGGALDSSVPTETRYSYVDTPAWHYDDSPLVDPAMRTWGEYRGFGTVDVVTGATNTAQLRSRTRFFRGMNGDRTATGTRAVSIEGIADDEQLNGFTREQITYDGAAEVAGVLSTPWASVSATGADGTKAFLLDTAVTEARTTAAALPGGKRTTRTTTTFDTTYGLPLQRDDQGDLATTADDKCTRLEYARNTTANIVTTVSRSETVGVSCAATPSRPADVLSDSRTLYDGGAFGAAPTRGLVTGAQELSGYNGSTPTYLMRATSAYDAQGRVTGVSDALGRVTTTEYVPATGGPLTSTTATTPDPDGTGPLTALSTTTVFEPTRGAAVSQTDPNGKVTSATLDALGRTTEVWMADRPTSKSPSVKYSYTVNAGGVNAISTSSLTAAETYRTGVVLYDGLLRPRQTQSPSASQVEKGRVVTDTIYDSRGLVVQENESWWAAGDPSTSIVVPTEAVPGRSRSEYDGAGRKTREIFEVAEKAKWETTTTYGGDRVTVDPPTGATPTTTIVDAQGRTTQLVEYLGSSPTGTSTTTSYSYDRSDQLTSVADTVGNRWTFEYDTLGRQVASNDPDKGRTTSTYDNADQLLTTTDARGVTLAMTYDALGRQTSVRDGSATGALRTSYVYDTVAKGQLTSATRHDGGASYTSAVTGYDDAYRPLGESLTIPSTEGALAGTYTTRYAYTIDGQLKSTSLPAIGNLKAETVTTSYDGANMPEWMSGGVGWGVYVAATRYSPYGELLQQDLGNSKSIQLKYKYDDGTRRLGGSWVYREGTAGFDRAATYTYDDAGNPTAVIDAPTVPGAQVDAQCYSYDGLRRLTEAWTNNTASCPATPSLAGWGGAAPYWNSYSYDAIGNRTGSVSHTPGGTYAATYSYPAAQSARPHAVSSFSQQVQGGASTWTYGYDAAGNTTSRQQGSNAAQTLTWDAEGRVASVAAAASGTDTYLYDAAGSRLVRRQGGSRTVYLPGGQEATVDAAGAVSAVRYYSFGGQTVAVRTGPKGSDVSSIISDPQGTAEMVVQNVTNTLTQRRDDPFGNPRGLQPASWPGDRGFVNQPKDATGFVQMGARYYDSLIGRFLSVDPVMDLGAPQQWAAYSYASNNPVTFSDPSGLLPGWAKKVGGKLSSWGKSAGKWIDKHQADIVGFAVGAVAGGACLFVTGGWGSVACFAAAGAAASAASNLWRTKVQKTQAFSWSGFATEVGVGAAIGAIPGLGKVAMEIPAVRGAVTAATRPIKGAVARVTQSLLRGGGGKPKPALEAGGAKPAAPKNPAKGSTDAPSSPKGESCTAGAMSFAGATLVLMGDGTRKAIADIKVGDTVIASDPYTGEQKAKRVEHVFVHTDTLTDLVIGGAVVTTTEDHPFWSVTDAQFERADELAPGELVLSSDGREVPVQGVRPATAHNALAYNLSVAEIHTYYVLAGETSVLVHNCAAPNIRVSPMSDDWATKGAHMHVGSSEVRVFPTGDGGVGFEGLRMSNGMASTRDVLTARDAIMGSPALRDDLMSKARSAMTEMNDHNWGNSVNRAAEMNFLIKALEKIE